MAKHENAHNAPVIVLGLGRFGASTASQLVRLGHEVLAIDSDAELVQQWADRLTHTAQADARNFDALRQLGAAEFPIAVVGVGTSIEASVLITANLVDLGVPRIWAKAISRTHGKILRRIGAHEIVYPEAEAGERAAHLLSGRLLDFIEFEDDFSLVKMHAPAALCQGPGVLANVARKYGVTIFGVKNPGNPLMPLDDMTAIEPRDIIIVGGTESSLEKFAAID